MEDKCKQCFRCSFLERYYIKGDKQYNKAPYGLCIKSKGNVNVHNSCEMFSPKPFIKKRKVLMERCLNDILIEITEIRKVIEEEYGEENTDV